MQGRGVGNSYRRVSILADDMAVQPVCFYLVTGMRGIWLARKCACRT
ncbi:hypothetical protein BH11PSE12_BH11PSE12_26690 [soil metagenome]